MFYLSVCTSSTRFLGSTHGRPHRTQHVDRSSVQPSTPAANATLLAFAAGRNLPDARRCCAGRRAAAATAAIDRHLPAGPTAANLPPRRAVLGRDRQTDRRTDGRTPDGCMSPASPCSADKYRYRPSNWRRKCSGCSPGGAGAWTVTLSWFSVLDE